MTSQNYSTLRFFNTSGMSPFLTLLFETSTLKYNDPKKIKESRGFLEEQSKIPLTNKAHFSKNK